MTTNIGYKCAFAAMAAALTIGGQTTAMASGKVQADIPFAFQAAGKTMRAGRYLIVPAQAQGVVQIIGENGDAALMTLDLPAVQTDAKPKLVFVKRAGAPALIKIDSRTKKGPLAGR